MCPAAAACLWSSTAPFSSSVSLRGTRLIPITNVTPLLQSAATFPCIVAKTVTRKQNRDARHQRVRKKVSPSPSLLILIISYQSAILFEVDCLSSCFYPTVGHWLLPVLLLCFHFSSSNTKSNQLVAICSGRGYTGEAKAIRFPFQQTPICPSH